MRLPELDLDLIVERSIEDLRNFDRGSLLVTGGTGFVGSWLVESALHARRRFGLRLDLTVLSRDSDAYMARRPHLANVDGLRFVRGDVRSPLPVHHVDGIIHAATATSKSLNDDSPAEMLDVISAGMTNVVRFAQACGEIPLLFTSSGAVYGAQPTDVERVTEDHIGAPDPLDPRSAYHEGKRVAELIGAIGSSESSIRFVPARLFAFLGPLLPLDTHFAAGNFLRDGLAGRVIVVNGDGTPLRSYLHPIDLCTWLWALLARGTDRRAYNVGSEHAVSIAELAELIAAATRSAVDVRQTPTPGAAPARYVPSTERARSELGLIQRIDLREAIERTLEWHRRVG